MTAESSFHPPEPALAPPGPSLVPPGAGVLLITVSASYGAGGGVILDRAAAVVLGKDRGFHIRLDGLAERRVAQDAVIEGISEEHARERLRAVDAPLAWR